MKRTWMELKKPFHLSVCNTQTIQCMCKYDIVNVQENSMAQGLTNPIT